MAQHYFSLTKNEWEIMEVMWKAGRPLSRAEVIALSEDRTWRASSFHVLMNSLLEKGAVKVVGFGDAGQIHAFLHAEIHSGPGFDADAGKR